MLPLQFSFEEMMPNFNVKGFAAIFEGAVPQPPVDPDPTNSSRIVQARQDWYLYASWRQEGWLNHALCGKWHLRVFFEEMGRGEFELMKEPIDVPFVSEDPYTYRQIIPFQATRVQVPPGLYKPTFSLTMTGPKGVAIPVAAVAEGPVLQFYKVGP